MRYKFVFDSQKWNRSSFPTNDEQKRKREKERKTEQKGTNKKICINFGPEFDAFNFYHFPTLFPPHSRFVGLSRALECQLIQISYEWCL